MSNKFITQAGSIKLAEEIDFLKSVERPKIIEAVSYARSLGDLSENAEYHAAKEKQGIIEAKIMQLETIQGSAEIININDISDKNAVRFGAIVTFIDLETEKESTIKIASEYEADVKNGVISISTPIASALIGKAVGDVCDIKLGDNIKEIEVLKISY